MNIIVINGSPAGKKGVTAQFMKYLEIQFSQHSFQTIEVGRKIKLLERDESEFDSVVQGMKESDAIIWCFPVYFMLVPAQLKQFIELLCQMDGTAVLTGKICTAISTSANFYDHTAHDYLHGVCSDLGCRYVRGYSAEMNDLFSESGRKSFMGFADDFLWKVSKGVTLEDTGWLPIQWTPPDLTAFPLLDKVPKRNKGKVVVVSDAEPDDHNLQRMIEIFERSVSQPVDRIELSQLKIKGGCLGCMRCGDGDPCVQKDDYAAAFERVKEADVVIYAGAVRDRYLSARFKVFIDRYFVNGHRAVLKAGLFGYIISGPLNQLAPLRETLEASIQRGHHHRLGIVSDEHPDPKVTADYLCNMASALERWMVAPWHTPDNFLGVGGHKVFRDLVFGLKGFMTADHRHYKSHGLYDFPQSKFSQRIFNAVFLTLSRIPMLKKHLAKIQGEGRMMRFKKFLEEI